MEPPDIGGRAEQDASLVALLLPDEVGGGTILHPVKGVTLHRELFGLREILGEDLARAGDVSEVPDHLFCPRGALDRVEPLVRPPHQLARLGDRGQLGDRGEGVRGAEAELLAPELERVLAVPGDLEGPDLAHAVGHEGPGHEGLAGAIFPLLVGDHDLGVLGWFPHARALLHDVLRLAGGSDQERAGG
jgi:hypothetical protein